MKLTASIVTALLIFSGIGWLVLAKDQTWHEDDLLYNQFVTIRGAVRVTEPETRKTFVPVGQGLIFQRIDCKGCLVVAVTDENGEYKLRVGKGKYRVVVRNCGEVNKSIDCVAPDQSRIVDASNTILDNVFDIKLVRPASPLDITLPSSMMPPSRQQ